MKSFNYGAYWQQQRATLGNPTTPAKKAVESPIVTVKRLKKQRDNSQNLSR